jgi:chaperone required for assembly of F1-ATPase
LEQALIIENSTEKRKIFHKYSVTNAREVAQWTHTPKQKLQTKDQRITRYEKGKLSISEKGCSIKTPKKNYRVLARRIQRPENPPPLPLYGNSRALL